MHEDCEKKDRICKQNKLKKNRYLNFWGIFNNGNKLIKSKRQPRNWFHFHQMFNITQLYQIVCTKCALPRRWYFAWKNATKLNKAINCNKSLTHHLY